MRDFHYALIRYIADPERMEPVNIGIILQGEGRCDWKVNKYVALRKDVDTEEYRRWKEFLEIEITGKGVPLFQPDRKTPAFINHLANLCGAPIGLSQALYYGCSDLRCFEDVLVSLYTRLVAQPETPPKSAVKRPIGCFRQIADERQFQKRGLRKNEYVTVNNERLWPAYRQMRNGELIAFDKVEVNVDLDRTAREITCLSVVKERLPVFLREVVGGQRSRYFLLADDFTDPISQQSHAAFEAMRDEYESAIEQIKRQGGRVLRTTHEVEDFAEEIDRKLPQR